MLVVNSVDWMRFVIKGSVYCIEKLFSMQYNSLCIKYETVVSVQCVIYVLHYFEGLEKAVSVA